MNLTPRVLRAVAVVGVATVAPLLAAMPAHAGIRIPGGPAEATAEQPPGPGAADFPPGPNADIIAHLNQFEGARSPGALGASPTLGDRGGRDPLASGRSA